MKIDFSVFVLAKDCGEVLKFASVYEIQKELERQDIENREYDAWDCNGLPLNLKVQPPVWLNIEAQSSEPQLGRLAEALKKYGSTVGVEVKIEKMTAAEFNRVFHQISSYAEKQSTSKGILRRIIRRRR